MAPPASPIYCCCCIPLRNGVAYISLIMIALALYSAWTFISPGVHGIASIIFTSVAIAIYTFLGLFGLVAVKKKTYKLLRRFSILWWTFTVISSLAMLAEIFVLFTVEKNQIKRLCKEEFAGDETGYNLELIDSCSSFATTVAAITFGVHVVVMTYFGLVVRRYAQVLRDRLAMDGLEHSTQIQLNDVEQSADAKN
ncbi:MAG: hypothetical protein J3Q66DRAFT_335026 [Benniella sp.]|nr:MAG: hypothetical protein J3Q66DRAFT_335026 [Benniella sp.]